MKLVSTFFDYYDPYFDGEGEAFHRTGGNVGPARPVQFKILEEGGFATPPHGLFENLIGIYWPEEDRYIERCVVYDNENAHCGEGKRMSARQMEEFDRSNGKYACAYVGDPNANGVSWRRLQVGPHVFWIEYRSTESWMSNVGDGSCEVIGIEQGRGFHPTIQAPLFAVDFVLGKEMYAVDLNFAPGVRGSGVEKVIDGREFVRAIEEWHKQ